MERTLHPAPLRPPIAVVPGLVAAQVVLPCADLAATLAWFTDQLGFRVEVISPADDPSVVVIAGLGVRLRLERSDADGASSTPACAPALVLTCNDPSVVRETELVAPNGTRVLLVPADPPLDIPPVQQSFVLSRAADSSTFHQGRAGMGYRDLVPDRQGGRFIASHILIDDEGPVPDYVHFHQVRFQMIFVARGWVELVYEDQGEPFVMYAGDCVLQPPTIRHRVLRSSGGLEVVELGCPAIHDTFADPTMSLPTRRLLPTRPYGNRHTGTQRFVRHIASNATWHPHRPGFEQRDTGIGGATDGVAGARVFRPITGHGSTTAPAPTTTHDGELMFWFVLGGSVRLEVDGREPIDLVERDSVVLPQQTPFRFCEPTTDLEVLEVTLPA